MSWIRIDDDTYIDDSLVTCAEYQLFIDEMRAQGKYHQPDHWTEYQFPKGHARQPILGMRHSDAVAFCEWLTSKKNGENWLYRIPQENEANQYPIISDQKTIFGYWISPVGSSRLFFWACQKVPPCHHNIALESPGLAATKSWETIWKEEKLKNEYDQILHSGAGYGSYEESRYYEIQDELQEIPGPLFSLEEIEEKLQQTLTKYFDRSLPFETKTFTLIQAEMSEILKYLDDFSPLVNLEERKIGNASPFEGIRLVKDRIR